MSTTPRIRPWVKLAAYAVPLCVLPSAAWRTGHVIDSVLNGSPCTSGAGETIYVTSLSAVSMTAALLTIGLVRPWGEVIPSWIPVLGGRPVSVRGATVAAFTGATLIALLCVHVVLALVLGYLEPPAEQRPGCEPPSTEVWLTYVPLLAWAPLLYAVTGDYYRRRRYG